VSTSEDRAADEVGERAALQSLEGAVGKLLDRLRTVTVRAEKADVRRAEVEDLLRRITTGDESPATMNDRLQTLEVENEDLRARLTRGRETVERLLAKIRFLEEQR
jgi:predicted nuclease with TOPRIM domain